ncbi:MAG: hypothetical protein LBI17_02680 [Rickettsiales bacterium]|jgi:hypothetical protein|nr:hypothetical protein [Rickettsiales bacterium]
MQNASEKFESTMISLYSKKAYGINHPRDAESYLSYIRRAHRLFVKKLRDQSRPTQEDIASSIFLRREYRLYSAKLANVM